MEPIYFELTVDDFQESDSIEVDDDAIDHLRINLPFDFECRILIKCRNLTNLIIVDSDEAEIQLAPDVRLNFLQCFYSVSDDRDDYELFKSMRDVYDNYNHLISYPMIVQEDYYSSPRELMDDINEEYYIYENSRRGFWTDIYDKYTKEFICRI